MYSLSLPLRLLSRGAGAASSSAASFHRPISTACAATAQSLGKSQLQQRRYASSKPPASDGIAAAAAAKGGSIDTTSRAGNGSAGNANSASAGSNANANADSAAKPLAKRGRGRKSSAAAGRKAGIAASYNLPKVPSTQHVDPNDIHVASFFSVHRPISVTASVPKFINQDAFNTIFSPRPAHNPANVINTLSSTVQSFESALPHGATANLDAESLALDENAQLDIQSRLDQIYKPFTPPAPPVPKDGATIAAEAAEREKVAAAEQDPVQKSYSSVLTIRESKHGDGHTTYEAHTTPFVQIEEKEAPSQYFEEEVAIREPESGRAAPTRFLERMHERQMRFDAHRQSISDMFAISVKRQRKLKMKKHKHKKFLRRTRNERRKMDKA